MGVSAIMANTAIALAGDVTLMARAFGEVIRAGRNAYLSRLARASMPSASSPLTGFLNEN